MLRKHWSLYVHIKLICHCVIMPLCHLPLAAIMPLCTAYNIQHTTSHHAYDIYTSTTSSMQVCNNNLKCQHFSPNCADVLNVGSVPTPDLNGCRGCRGEYRCSEGRTPNGRLRGRKRCGFSPRGNGRRGRGDT